MILYAFNGLVCSGICYYLYMINAPYLKGLRLTLLWFFLSLAIYQLGWAIHITLFGNGVPVNTVPWYIVNAPFTVALINLINYLRIINGRTTN
jgi:hypothetical protein